TLPESILKRSKSGNIRYILAKRLFKKGRDQEALNELNAIDSGSPSYPFVTHLRATIYSALGKNQEAEQQFKDCIRYSEKFMGRAESQVQRNQLEVNRDYCVAGIG